MRWCVVSVATLLVLGLGCAGMGGGTANQDACKKWVETQNALPCMGGVKQDAAQVCPATLDQVGLDWTGFYSCMEKNAKCNGQIPDLIKQTECKTPTM